MNKPTVKQLTQMQNVCALIEAADEAAADNARAYDFTCPVCGNQAHAVRWGTEYLYAECDDCGIRIRQ
jgi:hypothetical protein